MPARSGAGTPRALKRRVLGDLLDSRDNALNLLRLILASAVIVGHVAPNGGFGVSRWESAGDIAVNGFFTVSGFLVMGSRMRLPFQDYLWRRVARIYPGFLVCLVVTAVGFAPLSTLITGQSMSPGSALAYVLGNLAIVITQHDIPHTLDHAAYPEAWNGSLWTLSYEVAAYLAAGALLTAAWVRRHATTVLTVLLAGASVAVLVGSWPIQVENAARLAAFFLAGMLLRSCRAALPLHGGLAALALVVNVAMIGWAPAHVMHALTPLPMAYLLLWAGVTLPWRFGNTNDISYGVYIYAFPCQQLLAMAGATRWGPVVYGVISLAVTLVPATLSWFVVERPALRLSHSARRRWLTK